MANNGNVYVFDDNQDILYLCDVVLTDAGYQVTTAETCDDIIAQLEAAMPDLVMMDNQIPIIGGIEATRRIKAHPKFKHIPVLYFSASTNIQQLAAQAGADDYLSKPFDLTELERKVQYLIAATKTNTQPYINGQ